jgi:hypothetical protein
LEEEEEDEGFLVFLDFFLSLEPLLWVTVWKSSSSESKTEKVL